MNIGLDFDGVISNAGQLKSEGAKKLYNVHVPPGQFKKELLVPHILTAEQYRHVQKNLEAQIAHEWLMLHKLMLPITSTGFGNSKAEACKGLDVYVDDDLDKLEPLVGIVPHRFLFTWEYNTHTSFDPAIAVRVNSWEQFYTEIKKVR